jgi:HD-like signal output (HDOD) protein/CheY-like chemotaxis protein
MPLDGQSDAFVMGLLQVIKDALAGRRPESAGSGQEPSPENQGVPGGAEEGSEIVPARIPRSILFVEVDATSRALLAECLAQMADEWPSQVVSSAEEGLKVLASGNFDGVAASFRLDDTSGLEFLRKASEIKPETVFFLQASAEDRATLTKQPGLPPHFLPHPPTVTELSESLERSFLLMRWMSGSAIRALLARMVNLPAVPSLYARVMRELRSDDPSIDAVGKLIAQDPALTAKMLQMVNSPVFALGRPIGEAVDAVTFLGAERTKALILMASLSLHGSLTPCEGFSQESFWQHSLTVATLGRLLALKELKDATLADTCFTAGLLHDIGKLLFASNLPHEYSGVIASAKACGISLDEAERAAFGVTHGQLGASLLGTWGLPMAVLEAIAWHEDPASAEVAGYSAVTVVHIANVLEYEKRGAGELDRAPHFAQAYLEGLSLQDRLNRWRSLCGCPARSEAPVARAA